MDSGVAYRTRPPDSGLAEEGEMVKEGITYAVPDGDEVRKVKVLAIHADHATCLVWVKFANTVLMELDLKRFDRAEVLR